MTNQYRVVFTNFAETDLAEIVDYYRGKNPAFVASLVDKIEERCNELERFPAQGRVVPELEQKSIVDYRELVEGNYRILYHVRDKQVYILAILDARRNLEELIISKLMRLP